MVLKLPVSLDKFRGRTHTCCVCSLYTWVCSVSCVFSLLVSSSWCWRKESCSRSEGSVAALLLASCSDLRRFSMSLLCFSLSVV